MKQPIPFGNYYLMDLIAKGGMAEVFKAKYLGPEGFSKVVALKRILPELAEEQEFIRMFIDEAKIASQLSHANITGILQLGEAHGTYFIAMEFVQGKDLRTIYERSRRDTGVPVSPPMAAFVLGRVCEGIDYAHRRRGDTGKHLGIIHRDVSPQNIIVSYEGDVKLIDFGIAKAQDKLVKTEAGILKGKYCYMSPEQVRGLDIDHRSDIFGLGVVLHEILTRQRLFLGANDLKTLENVLKQPIEPPSTINPAVPAELDAITMKALSRNVDERYQYASEMHEELQRFLYSRPSVFSRRELSNYMNSIFGADLDKELRRQASYEPFFEALPNTPMPSAMHLSSPSSTALAAAPPSIAPAGAMTTQQPSLDSNPGSYISNISQPNTGRSGDVTSYSGPHPNPAVQAAPVMATPAAGGMVAPSAPPPAFPMSNPTSSMMPPPSARRQAPPAPPKRKPAATVQGGVQFIPGGVYKPEPPAQPSPSYMFGGDDDFEDDDDPTVLELSGRGAKKPPATIKVDEDDLPTKQLDYQAALAAIQEPEVPMTAPLMPAPQFPAPTAAIPQPHIPNEDLLQPLQPAQPAQPLPPPQQQPPPPPQMNQAAHFLPPQPQAPAFPTADLQTQALPPEAAQLPPPSVGPSFDDLDEGTETLMEQAVGGGSTGTSASNKGWIITIIFLLMLLIGGLGGAYMYRCKLLGICPPEPIYYTLVFAKPANNVDLLVDGKLLPPHKYERIAPNKLRLRFFKPGAYWIEVRKQGCQPLRNKARIVSGTEVETPHLPLTCR